MKTSIVIFAIVMMAYVAASPAKSLVKPAPKQCLACPDSYTPVCGGDGVAKSITFGNECVMTKYNCEQDKQFKVLSKGECPGGGSVRLS